MRLGGLVSGLSFEGLRGCKALIVGEVASGKTRLTRLLLREALGLGEPVTVLDFAPPRGFERGRPLGGRLLVPGLKVDQELRSPNLHTPRLSGATAQEVEALAKANAVETTRLIQRFLGSPTPCLFVNDVSIHLQAGELGVLWEAMEAAETVVANGYLGGFLRDDKGSGVSRRERGLMLELVSRVDRVIHLSGEETGLVEQLSGRFE